MLGYETRWHMALVVRLTSRVTLFINIGADAQDDVMFQFL